MRLVWERFRKNRCCLLKTPKTILNESFEMYTVHLNIFYKTSSRRGIKWQFSTNRKLKFFSMQHLVIVVKNVKLLVTICNFFLGFIAYIYIYTYMCVCVFVWFGFFVSLHINLCGLFNAYVFFVEEQ